jgi:signal transduction histidine kinase
MSTQAQTPFAQPLFGRLPIVVRGRNARYIGGVLALAAAYYGAAKAGQALRYTGSVSAVWPPAGLGIGALYLFGLRWWPGVFLGDLVANLELLLGHDPLPLGSLVGQQLGNMAEILIGAALMRRLIGPRAGLDRIDQVTGLFLALAVATAISATIGTFSMLAGGVITTSELTIFWRTWWLGDLSGSLIVVPLLIVWIRDPRAAWRRVCTWEGGLLLLAVSTLPAVAVSSDATVTYVVFPVLIWAATRFRAPGATLAVAIVAGMTIGMTAHHLGPFARQQIDSRTLGTQLYICVAALTTLFLAALVAERERSTAALMEAKRDQGEAAIEERHRIARDLHDSVSQALFSTILQTRTAEKALQNHDVGPSGRLAEALAAIGDLTKGAQSEMRGLIFELRRDPVENGLLAALSEYAEVLFAGTGPEIAVAGPVGRLPLARDSEAELFGIGREALTNIGKHADAANASVRVDVLEDLILLEISDDGHGFDQERREPAHYGLDSMLSRARDIGAALDIFSSPGVGTVIRIEVPLAADLDGGT